MEKSLYIFVFLFSFLGCKPKNRALFEVLSTEKTKLNFTNLLTEDFRDNILTYEYFYNGGGIAVLDVNNDGLLDLFFSGNQVENKLFLNKGNLEFEDISTLAGIKGRIDGWKTGVTVADVNSDGYADIYLCYSGLRDKEKRRNELYINNKNNTFSEKAKEFGLGDYGYSTQAAFLDFDKDGDLDLFLINHNLKNYERKEAHIMRAAYDTLAGDKLFQNHNGKFIEISQKAGIRSNPLGFGLGLSISDINNDGWLDIYVGNDYVEDDYLYINQKNGTFKESIREHLDHTSHFTMGTDISDINNDFLPDILTLDMLPESNYRQKLLLFPDSWNTYQAQLNNGFYHQNMRNMLHLNMGNGLFSEISHILGISATDWSWCPLIEDFDNDGLKDIFITNGLAKDYTNSDFARYYADIENKVNQGETKQIILDYVKKMPSTPIKNAFFHQTNTLTFVNKTDEFGFGKSSLANGAVYADLDNDGDLEIITSSVNQPARLYKNNAEKLGNNYLKIQLNQPNTIGIGAKIELYSASARQMKEYIPTKGFQSSITGSLNFGIGKDTQIDSIIVYWQSGKKQKIVSPKINSSIQLFENQSTKFTIQAISRSLEHEKMGSINFEEKNNFSSEILLPLQYSYQGTCIETIKANEDLIFIGGTPISNALLFIQDKKGKVTQKQIKELQGKYCREAIFVDIDKDLDLDLYVACGDFQSNNPATQQDVLLLNDGKNNFSSQNLPVENQNNSAVVAADFDRDGDIDFFIGGHSKPYKYPLSEASFFLLNNNKSFVRENFENIGLITKVISLDIEKDGWEDLILIGEWMPITVLHNKNGKFEKEIIPKTEGWWFTAKKADLDNDGFYEVIVGNLGENTLLKASEKYPLQLNFSDFDKNGTMDSFICQYENGKLYPVSSRDEVVEQLPALRKKYTQYHTFAKATWEEILGKETHSSLLINTLKTSILVTKNGKFDLQPLPYHAQWSSVQAIEVFDENKDGKLDILLAGNLSKLKLRYGKTDANQGFIFQNNGNSTFSFQKSIGIRGDIRAFNLINHYFWYMSNESIYRMPAQ